MKVKRFVLLKPMYVQWVVRPKAYVVWYGFGSAQVEDVEDVEVDGDDQDGSIQHSSAVSYR